MFVFDQNDQCPVFLLPAGLPDSERLECHVQHPRHPRDVPRLHPARALRPRPLRGRPGREQEQPIQLRAVRRRRPEMHRPRARPAGAQNARHGAAGHGRVDTIHRHVSQHANGAHRSPSQWTPRQF